jgi:hypothetical protein
MPTAYYQHPWLRFAFGDGADRRGVLGERLEPGDELGHRGGGEGGARREVRAAAAQVPGQGVQVEVRSLGEDLAERAGGLDEGFGGARRQRQQVGGVRRHRPRVGRRALRAILGQQAVPVGPPEPEGVDPDHRRTLAERLTLGLHPQPGEVDVRIGHREMPGDRGVRPALEHQEHLEQGAGEGGGLHVPHVALYAGHSQRDRSGLSSEDLPDRVPFNPVPDAGPGGVCLDVVHVLRRHTAKRLGPGLSRTGS